MIDGENKKSVYKMIQWKASVVRQYAVFKIESGTCVNKRIIIYDEDSYIPLDRCTVLLVIITYFIWTPQQKKTLLLTYKVCRGRYFYFYY